MPDIHALLAPSAAKRWMTCSPSARVESILPDRTTTYAEEGTIAHSVAESFLRFYKKSGVIAVFDNPWGEAATFYNFDLNLNNLQAQCEEKGFDFREIFETVHDRYVRVVWDDFVRAKAEDPAAELLIEQRVELNDFVPDSFGSSDAIIIAGKRLQVYDLKYGRGVRVSAKGNPQMRLYALGALMGPAETFPIEDVTMTIVQPRLNAVSSDKVPVRELADWAVKVLAPAARKAYMGDGDYVPGDHCEFCKAKATCPALSEYTRRVTTTYAEPTELSAEELAAVLPTLPVIEGWIAAVRSRAQETIEKGGSVPGWKLVEGRSTRRIFKEAEARKVLSDAGFKPEDYDKVSLRGLTELQRLVGGAKTFNTLLGDLVERQPGKPTLAPADDPRKDYNPADSAEDSFGSML